MRSGRTKKFEVYMLIHNRRRLARLIQIQGVSKRAVARAAGWDSHTYLLRLLNGKANTCKPDAAVKIAAFLGFDINDVFVSRTTSDTGRCGQERAA